MTNVIADRVKETSTTAGVGTLNLGGAVAGFQSFVNGIGNGRSCPYLIDDGNGNWELTWGTVTSGVPATISRGTIIASSNAGARINFGATSKTVACVPAAELFLWVGVSPAIAETDIASAATTDIGNLQTLRARITGTVGITGFGTSPNTLRIVRFAAALTLTHNAASLILLGGANHTTAAGDIGMYASDAAGNWRELFYCAAAYNPAAHTGTGAFVHAADPSFTGTAGFVNISASGQVNSSSSMTSPAYYSAGGSTTMTYTWNSISASDPSAANIDMIARTNGVRLANGATSWSALSSPAVKHQLQAMDDFFGPDADPLEIIGAYDLAVGRYLWDEDDARMHPFLMYPDVEINWPFAARFESERTVQIVQRDESGAPVLDETGAEVTVDCTLPQYMGVSLEQHVPLLMWAFQRQRRKNAEMEARLTALEARP